MDGMAKKVYLISRGDWSGEVILQDKVASSKVEVLKGYDPLEIHGEEKVEGLSIQQRDTGERKQLQLEGVFIEVGLSLNSDYALDLLETNQRGEIHVDREMDTGVRGVFAAGDVTDGREKQVVIAAGDGARAALAAFTYLVHQA
jgi:alkyl hydroperoxide reductase subunit F